MQNKELRIEEFNGKTHCSDLFEDNGLNNLRVSEHCDSDGDVDRPLGWKGEIGIPTDEDQN